MKQKLLKNAKILFIIFTFVVLAINSVPAFAAMPNLGSNVVTIAYYEDKCFTEFSEPELITLVDGIDSISLCAVCDDSNATDILMCHISSFDDEIYNNTLAFPADGSVTTYFDSLPAGRYRVFFTGGDQTIAHALVAFTVVL